MLLTPDRKGGFSLADPTRLYLPALTDTIHGHQAVNVEAQSRNPSSLLNWRKWLITARQGRKVSAADRVSRRLSRAHGRNSLVSRRRVSGARPA